MLTCIRRMSRQEQSTGRTYTEQEFDAALAFATRAASDYCDHKLTELHERHVEVAYRLLDLIEHSTSEIRKATDDLVELRP